MHPILASSEAEIAAFVCVLAVVVPLFVIWLVWRFFQTAVKSGVQAARPTAVDRYQSMGQQALTESDVRQIVREEVRAIQEEARARRGGTPGAKPPGPSPGPSR